MTLVITVVALVVILGCYLTLLATRLDRLAIRVEAAAAALDAQLARRSIAAYDLTSYELVASDLTSSTGPDPSIVDLRRAARRALAAAGDGTAPIADRAAAESALSQALRAAPRAAAEPELAVAARKVMLARQFHNDAVRDLLALRRQPIVRVLHLYGRAQPPAYAEFDADEPSG